MQTEARVGVVVEGGGQRALNSGHADGGARKFSQQQQQPLHQKSQIGTVSQLLAGGVAGALSKTCTAPLARLTILFQVQGMHSDVATLRKTSIWHEASRIVGEEGFRAFWKGNLVTIAHRLPYSSVSFYAYEHYKKLLKMIPGLESRRENMSADICVHFVAGGLAGITAASVTYPLDLVRTRLAAQTNVIYYRGIWHALQTISKEEGILGLYKGLGATLLGVGPSIAISFSVYETLRSFWKLHRPDDSTVLVSLACGSLSGIASSTATFPLDLVRRRKQLEGAGGRPHVYTTGLFGTFRHITRTEGLRGLYRGILPEYYKVVPGLGICFMTYETLKKLLADITDRL
ncbi:mitochondrial substrate carrier family protein B-like isoform X1 [Juglans microcarpa x Juglans regia]|uniref:mitochondrial substrate carrier family protein B-like isoform X1 n=1 Tax=Juglans microcarpa x Juglans regia TaxID=2249226 RepID=UPI001B7F6A0C|nr:mitochondrial substrate carrier family protein B-like isoform X1 [Juglans microcarpa x Juglans regia]